MPDQSVVQMHTGTAPSMLHPQMPLFAQAGEQLAKLAIAQLAPDHAAVQVQTDTLRSAFQPHVPPFEHADEPLAVLAVVQSGPDTAGKLCTLRLQVCELSATYPSAQASQALPE